VKYG